MKISTAVLSIVIASASAFAPQIQNAPSTNPLKASVMDKPETVEAEVKTPEVKTPEKKVDIPPAWTLETAEDTTVEKTSSDPKEDPKNRIQPGRYNDKENSIAIPFLKRPNKLDGTHAGDYGFDPLGFTENYDLYTMQEAEIRHARLAMLAVVGWPMSELLAPEWMLQENGCAPSVLNGFNPLTFLATALFFGAAGYFEWNTSLRRVDNTDIGMKHKEDMANIWKYGVAGDYNFDPLGLYSSIGDDAIARKGLRELEISHGRSAMLGITSFVIWENLTGHPIVENSMFFHPNLLLPSLVAAYAFASSIYEVDNDGQYIRLKVSSEGEARLQNIRMGLNQVTPENTEGFVDSAKEVASKLVDASMNLKEKYNDVKDGYTKYTMRNID